MSEDSPITQTIHKIGGGRDSVFSRLGYTLSFASHGDRDRTGDPTIADWEKQQQSLLQPPTQNVAAQGAIGDAFGREAQARSASTILTTGAGLLDQPNTYSASRSLLGS